MAQKLNFFKFLEMADTEAPPPPVEDVEPEALAPIPLQYQGLLVLSSIS